jgi:hypothetical protein
MMHLIWDTSACMVMQMTGQAHLLLPACSTCLDLARYARDLARVYACSCPVALARASAMSGQIFRIVADASSFR